MILLFFKERCSALPYILEGIEGNHFVGAIIQSSREELEKLRKLRLELHKCKKKKSNALPVVYPSIVMKTQKVYLLIPIPNLRGYHPIACSGKPKLFHPMGTLPTHPSDSWTRTCICTCTSPTALSFKIFF